MPVRLSPPPGAIFPSATVAVIAARAAVASDAELRAGRTRRRGRSLRGGNIPHGIIASLLYRLREPERWPSAPAPPASPSRSAWAASVALWRAPRGLPDGLPDWPFLQRVACF